jgi:hypothetical protein
MNLDAAEGRVVLVYYFTVLALKFPLREASQSIHYSANNKTAEEIARGTFWHPYNGELRDILSTYL